MDKNVPHYNLTKIKRLISQKGISTFTRTARDGFVEMGLTEKQALHALLNID